MGEAARQARTDSIDLLRGAVMVLMVLDHARDFFVGVRNRPENLDTTSVALFLTRWVTHFCAPVFVLLAGTAAYLYATRHGADKLPRFLVTRGAWLVLLELTVVRMGWIPDPGYHFTLIQVIWVIGWSMIALAGISRLGAKGSAWVGGAIVVGHNLLDAVDASSFGAWAPLWHILHQRGVLMPAEGHRFFISYPLLPWIGVISLGYALGALTQLTPEARRRWLSHLGVVTVVSFLILRGFNLYGDPHPWTVQHRGAVFTVLSFLNCEKYPPSLAFLLMTLGPALLVLWALDGVTVRGMLRPVLTFGRVPLFFYVTHLFLLRYVSLPWGFARFGTDAFKPPPLGPAGSPELALWMGYATWAAALVLLYPACVWFARLKQRRRDWWLSYL